MGDLERNQASGRSDEMEVRPFSALGEGVGGNKRPHSRAARYSAHKRTGPKDVGDVGRNPASGRSDEMGFRPFSASAHLPPLGASFDKNCVWQEAPGKPTADCDDLT